MPNDTLWTGRALDDLRDEFGDVYRGRTAVVTGADGFMGSHLTEALVELGATVHAFVRATSSGALNNIGQLRGHIKVHFADLTDRTSVDYLVRELKETAQDRPYVFHLGAQAHVGESWHRPYETVAANVLGTLNLLQSIVDLELDVEKFDTAGTSEEYGNVRESVTEHHDFDEAGGLILHERSPINPKSIYATSKVAADFLTMNYFDAFLPRDLRHPARLRRQLLVADAQRHHVACTGTEAERRRHDLAVVAPEAEFLACLEDQVGPRLHRDVLSLPVDVDVTGLAVCSHGQVATDAVGAEAEIT